jgi:endonuclease I
MNISLTLKRSTRFVSNGKSLLLAILFGFINFTYATIPPNYYDGAIGKSGQTLQVALYDIILGHTAVSYTPGVWNAYYTTDLKGDGTIWDMYSDVPGGTPAYTFLPGTDQCGISYVEGSCYSREHSFPKSYFNSETPMYTDLHHLFPVDQYVNGTGHNNYPYGTVAAPAYTSSNGSKRGPCSYPGYTGTVFEPIDAYKGDFARAYFYMATRYQNLIASWPANDANADAILNGTSYPAYENWFLNMLLTWNAADPVSAKEIARNDAVYAIQHNRNPFIDHPEYVTSVWAPGGLKAEPSNHPTNYLASAGTPTYSSISLNWTDATGAVLPDGYLVKGSTVSFVAITNPVDGTSEADGGLIKNVSYGTHAQTFTGLTPSTTYYFKVYSYSNSGTDIDYKTDGSIQTTSLATTAGTSVLQPGDIAIIEVDATNPDRLSFITYKQITAGTVINFTDNGFTDPSTPRTGEGILIYTAPSTISAGTVISWYSGINIAGTGWNLSTSSSFSFNEASDQVFAYQGTWGSTQSLIFGINLHGSWVAGANDDAKTSCLPSTLINNQTALEIPLANGYYNWITNGSSSVISSIVPNPENWTTSASNLASPAWSFNLNSTSTTINNNTTVKYLSISSGETLTIAPTSQLTVTGTLTNAVPSGLVINSDASGTGSLIHSSDFVPATVNRYLPGASWAWHLLSSPVSQGIEGSDLVPSGSSYDLFCYDEPSNTWVNYKNTSVEPSWNTVNGSEFVPGRGYMSAYETANPTKQFTGLLNSGTISIDLTKSGSNTYNGYILAGNPYPSSIDWKAASGWTRNNLDLNSGGYDYYIYNSTAGNYGTFNSAGSSGTNGATQYIAQGQAFFVKASTTGSMSMTNNVRIHRNPSFLKESNEIERLIRLKINSLATNYSDEAILEFGHDSYGGSVKMTGYTEKAPSLMLPYEGSDYAIRFMQNSDDEHLVPLRFIAGESGDYEINAELDAAFFRMAQLEDVMTGQIYDLKTQADIQLSATKDDPSDRFILHLGLMGMEEHTNNELFTAYINGNDLKINNLIGKGKVTVFDLQGRLVAGMEMSSKGYFSLPLNQPSGLYIVHLQNESLSTSLIVVVK